MELLTKIDALIAAAKANAADTLEKVAEVMHSWEQYLRDIAAGLKKSCCPDDCDCRIKELTALLPAPGTVGAISDWLPKAIQVILTILEILKKQ